MSDWNQRYLDDDAPWDRDEPSGELLRVLEERGLPPGRALEIGCGSGVNVAELARRGFAVTGLDLAERAIERARARLAEANLTADLRAAGVHAPGELGEPFPFVFDRGVYHVLRREPDSLADLLGLLRAATAPGSLWLSVSGNANEPSEDEGPPVVSARELTAELEPLFELVELREIRFRARDVDGEVFAPLAWSALWRRRGVGPAARTATATG